MLRIEEPVPTFGVLQYPLQKDWVLCDSLCYQQDTFRNPKAPHQGAAHFFLRNKEENFSSAAKHSPRMQKGHVFSIGYICPSRSYLDKCMKALVPCVKIFEVIDSLVVVPAEFAVRFLHSLSVLPRELQRMGHTAPACTELLGWHPSSACQALRRTWWIQISPKHARACKQISRE